jgi:hypothetical protein
MKPIDRNQAREIMGGHYNEIEVHGFMRGYNYAVGKRNRAKYFLSAIIALCAFIAIIILCSFTDEPLIQSQATATTCITSPAMIGEIDSLRMGFDGARPENLSDTIKNGTIIYVLNCE